MKNLGIFKTNPDGTRTRISEDEFNQIVEADKPGATTKEGIYTGVNLGGRRTNDPLDQAIRQKLILTGDDIKKTLKTMNCRANYSSFIFLSGGDNGNQ